ncbi:hypothetical protein [Altererythrobacter sp.]|uniref:hypothetical protein n=1 Tax=Altererythrobacter sp. TaxID=1872480 RepID=UPI003D10CB9B
MLQNQDLEASSGAFLAPLSSRIIAIAGTPSEVELAAISMGKDCLGTEQIAWAEPASVCLMDAAKLAGIILESPGPTEASRQITAASNVVFAPAISTADTGDALGRAAENCSGASAAIYRFLGAIVVQDALVLAMTTALAALDSVAQFLPARRRISIHQTNNARGRVANIARSKIESASRVVHISHRQICR